MTSVIRTLCSLLNSYHRKVPKLTTHLANGKWKMRPSLSSCTDRLFHSCPTVLREYRPSSSPASFLHRANKDHRGTIRPGNRPATDWLASNEEEADEDDPSTALDDADYASLIHNAQGFGVGLGERAKLKGGVYVLLPWIKWGPKQKTGTTSDLLLEEACALVNSLQEVVVLGKEVIKVSRENEGALLGPGQIVNLSVKMSDTPGLSAVFVSVDRLPLSKIREFEHEFGVRVVDRYWVVLAIFHQHARTNEARMQVALAELPYIKSRTSHDHERAIIDRRMRRLQTGLKKLEGRRDHARRMRATTSLPSVAVVGYTNSGKTSIISALCDDPSVQGQDQLFATLDVTAHSMTFPCGLHGVLIDTVGFVQELPTPLLACFNATLQDAALADVVLHVRDMSHPDRLIHHVTVMRTLAAIKVSPKTPILTIDNKADLVNPNLASQVENKVLARQTVPPRTNSDSTSSKRGVTYLLPRHSGKSAEANFDDDFDCEDVPVPEKEVEYPRVEGKPPRNEQLQHWKNNYNSTPTLSVSAKTKQGLLTTAEDLEGLILNVTGRRMYRMKLPTGGEQIRILHRIVRFASETVIADCPEKTEVVVALTDQQLAQFKKSCLKLTASR